MRYSRLILGLLAAPLVACGDATSIAPLGSVTASGETFNPAVVTLNATTHVVTWGFLGGTHTVTFEDGATGSGQRNAGAFSRDFTSAAPGTYRYRCDNHTVGGSFTTGMVGSVIVPMP